MSAIEEVFKKGPAYIAYLTAGDGGLDRTLMAMQALVDGGVDILEIGVPFSDPVADGPIIQEASARAVARKIDLHQILRMIAIFKMKNDIPIILFSYFNPIYQANRTDSNIYKKMKLAGVDGILIVDLPMEESDSHYQTCIANEIDPIFLIAPSTTTARLTTICEKAKGMLYYVSRKGTTGMRTDLPAQLPDRIAEIKSMSRIPIVVGFGVSNRVMATSICQYADGFVVGSFFVNAVASGKSALELVKITRSLDPR